MSRKPAVPNFHVMSTFVSKLTVGLPKAGRGDALEVAKERGGPRVSSCSIRRVEQPGTRQAEGRTRRAQRNPLAGRPAVRRARLGGSSELQLDGPGGTSCSTSRTRRCAAPCAGTASRARAGLGSRISLRVCCTICVQLRIVEASCVCVRTSSTRLHMSSRI